MILTVRQMVAHKAGRWTVQLLLLLYRRKQGVDRDGDIDRNIALSCVFADRISQQVQSDPETTDIHPEWAE